MEDMPERIFAWWFLPEMRDDVMSGGWTGVREKRLQGYVRDDMFTALQSQARESALEALSAYGQAQEAYQAQLAAEAKLRDAIIAGMRIATSTPIEMVPVAILDAIDEITGATP